MTLLRIIAASICGVGILSSSAAAGAVDMDTASRMAVEASLDVQALRREQGVYEAGLARAGQLPNPVLELEGITGTASSRTIGAGIAQELVTGGKLGKRSKAAALSVDAQTWRIADRERLVRSDARMAFLDYLVARERHVLALRSAELLRQLADIATQRFEAGDIPEMDVLLARIEHDKGELWRLDAEASRDAARDRVMSLIQAKDDGLELAGDLVRPSFNDSLDACRDSALRNRPDLRVLDLERSRYEAEIAVAQAERTPNLSASLSFSREQTVDAGSRSTDNLVGLRLAIPLPVFDRNEAGIHEARSRKDAAGSMHAALARTIVREVESAYRRLAAALRSHERYLGMMPKVDGNMQLVLQAYQLGEVGILNAIEEQRKHIEARSALLGTLHEAGAALVALETATGAQAASHEGGRP